MMNNPHVFVCRTSDIYFCVAVLSPRLMTLIWAVCVSVVLLTLIWVACIRSRTGKIFSYVSRNFQVSSSSVLFCCLGLNSFPFPPVCCHIANKTSLQSWEQLWLQLLDCLDNTELIPLLHDVIFLFKICYIHTHMKYNGARNMVAKSWQLHYLKLPLFSFPSNWLSSSCQLKFFTM